jgi:D-alanine-D-alanine ligase
MKRLRVLALMHEDCVPPADARQQRGERVPLWKTEHDVLTMLEQLGHDVQPLGVATDLRPIREAVTAFRPHIVFNLLEEFHGETVHVPYVVGYLQLLGQAFTGCGPEGLIFAADKAMQKRFLQQAEIPVPESVVFAAGRTVKPPTSLEFPLIVKSTTMHGSACISQASVVNDDRKLAERVAFIHEQLQTDAIAEEFIHGRELYLGVMGNERLKTLPIWEMRFENAAEDATLIATERLKWNVEYQRKVGLVTHAADDLPEELERRIRQICRRAYRALRFRGYARMDLRLTPDGRIFLLECNPNPNIAFGDEFADAADHAGIPYAALLEQIVRLGLRRDEAVTPLQSAVQLAARA